MRGPSFWFENDLLSCFPCRPALLGEGPSSSSLPYAERKPPGSQRLFGPRPPTAPRALLHVGMLSLSSPLCILAPHKLSLIFFSLALSVSFSLSLLASLVQLRFLLKPRPDFKERYCEERSAVLVSHLLLLSFVRSCSIPPHALASALWSGSFVDISQKVYQLLASKCFDSGVGSSNLGKGSPPPVFVPTCAWSPYCGYSATSHLSELPHHHPTRLARRHSSMHRKGKFHLYDSGSCSWRGKAMWLVESGSRDDEMGQKPGVTVSKWHTPRNLYLFSKQA